VFCAKSRVVEYEIHL